MADVIIRKLIEFYDPNQSIAKAIELVGRHTRREPNGDQVVNGKDLLLDEATEGEMIRELMNKECENTIIEHSNVENVERQIEAEQGSPDDDFPLTVNERPDEETEIEYLGDRAHEQFDYSNSFESQMENHYYSVTSYRTNQIDGWSGDLLEISDNSNISPVCLNKIGVPLLAFIVGLYMLKNAVRLFSTSAFETFICWIFGKIRKNPSVIKIRADGGIVTNEDEQSEKEQIRAKVETVSKEEDKQLKKETKQSEERTQAELEAVTIEDTQSEGENKESPNEIGQKNNDILRYALR